VRRGFLGALLGPLALSAVACGTGAPAGEPGAVGAATAVAAGGERRTFEASLRGDAEVPGPGDPDGSGTATVSLEPGRGEVCFELRVEGVAEPTGAHLHEGEHGRAGPARLGFVAPEGGLAEGCVTAGDALLAAVGEAPEGFYVNVSTRDLPDGALRGQLDEAT
jgi:CHRD domain